MALSFVFRRDHVRRTKSGGGAYVRGHYAAVRNGENKENYLSQCPYCGTHIRSTRMPNGGWAHFEGGKALQRIKHPCFTIGQGLSKAPDRETRDLFDDESDLSVQDGRNRLSE